MSVQSNDVVQRALAKLPEECGSVRVSVPSSADHERFVLIFQDDPANWSGRLSIAAALRHFVRVVKVVGRDGATGPIDTAIAKTIPDDEIKERVLKDFLKESVIDASEFANAAFDTHFDLLGVDDETLYDASKLALDRDPVAFAKLEITRAQHIAHRLVDEMKCVNERRIALTAAGNIPILVGEALGELGVGYAVIDPLISAGSDRDRYMRLLRGEEPSLEHVISENFGAGGSKEAADATRTRARMQAGIRDRLMRPERFLRSMQQVLNEEECRALQADLSLAQGPQGRAVILEAELIAHGRAAAAAARYPLVQGRIGILAVLLGVFGAVVGVAASSAGYRYAVVALFIAAGCAAVVGRAWAPAVAWVIQAGIFLGGYAWGGRWGMLSAVIVGFLVTQIAVAECLSRRQTKARALDRLAGDLVADLE